MLANFFNDSAFVSQFQASFSYRHTDLYETGLQARVKGRIDSSPLCLFEPGEAWDEIRFTPVKKGLKALSYVVFLKYWAFLWNTVQIYRALGTRELQIVHVNNGGYPGASSCAAAVAAARLRGVKWIVYVVNNVAFPYSTPSRWLDYPLDRFVARSVSVFVTGSSVAGEKLREVLRLPRNKVTQIHNGIEPRPIREDRAQVRQRVHVSEGAFVIAVIALLVPRKGHMVLLEALKRIRDTHISDPPILLIEGSGPERDRLERFVQDSGLGDQVQFLPDEDHVFDLMNASDAVVLPSISNEDFPNVVLEAMSLGKAVIASRLSGTEEQIEDGFSGILVDPGDIDGLARAIADLAKDPVRRGRLGRNGQRTFQARFTAKRAVDRYRDLYLKLNERE